ncbi:hypothetical protein [Dactylosporangium sp. CA-233914]|uniref:hypothetical protein n=1 Tax=Dactylosporangium sp. CA-233914 TaxID=3239934 RepID=UPI003D8BF472
MAAPSPVAPSQAVVKYTVVAAGADGGREHLFGIAQQTLGDGRRYPEILELNRGRVQPDGRRMTDAVVEPGWILLLPVDARGARVRTGAVPSFAPAGISAGPEPARSPPGADTPSALPMRAAAIGGAVALLGLALLVRRPRRRAAATPRAESPEPAVGPGEL